MNNYYTDIVYQNQSICIKEENGFKSVIASEDINSQSLLLVEHVFSGSTSDCHLLVRDNEYLFNQLCPRVKMWNKEKKHKNKVSLTKVLSNCIGKNCDNVIIGDFISKFNHACVPNSVFFRAVTREHHDLVVNYIAIISTKNIKKGEEITIHYGFGRGHTKTDDFNCQCGKSKEERDKLCEIIYSIIINLQKNYSESIIGLVDVYEKKSKTIMTYQYLAKKGLVASNASIVSMTKTFVELLNSIYTEGTIEDKKNKMVDHVNELFFVS
jgi:hypothetical protein